MLYFIIKSSPYLDFLWKLLSVLINNIHTNYENSIPEIKTLNALNRQTTSP